LAISAAANDPPMATIWSPGFFYKLFTVERNSYSYLSSGSVPRLNRKFKFYFSFKLISTDGAFHKKQQPEQLQLPTSPHRMSPNKE
jgi:hypothetical protein